MNEKKRWRKRRKEGRRKRKGKKGKGKGKKINFSIGASWKKPVAI